MRTLSLRGAAVRTSGSNRIWTALSGCWKRAYEDRYLLKETGMAGSRFIRQRFTWEKTAEALLKVCTKT
jgi:hypothetical protein